MCSETLNPSLVAHHPRGQYRRTGKKTSRAIRTKRYISNGRRKARAQQSVGQYRTSRSRRVGGGTLLGEHPLHTPHDPWYNRPAPYQDVTHRHYSTARASLFF
eukprot:3940234-Rhodomonas_salina.2